MEIGKDRQKYSVDYRSSRGMYKGNIYRKQFLLRVNRRSIKSSLHYQCEEHAKKFPYFGRSSVDLHIVTYFFNIQVIYIRTLFILSRVKTRQEVEAFRVTPRKEQMHLRCIRVFSLIMFAESRPRRKRHVSEGRYR